METKGESPAAVPAATGAGTTGDQDKRSTQRAEPKNRRTLREILARSQYDDPKRWLHRFDAERLVGDHCLPSTVSELEKKGIRFDRADVEVPGHRGTVARLTAYRVAPESIQRALELLAAP